MTNRLFFSLTAMVLLLVAAVIVNDEMHKKGSYTYYKLTPQVCIERCSPLPVSFYSPGYQLLVDKKGAEFVKRNNGSYMNEPFEIACACGTVAHSPVTTK